jgi:hypothetical protein
VLTTVVLGFSAAHLVLNLIAAILRGLHRRAIGEAMAGSGGAIGRIGSLDSVLTGLDRALLTLTVLGVGSLIVWALVVRGLFRRYGAEPTLLRRRVFAVALLLVLVQWALNGMSGLTLADDNFQVVSDSGRGVDLTQIVAALVRMTIAVLIAYWAWTVRGRVSGVLTDERGGGPRSRRPERVYREP